MSSREFGEWIIVLCEGATPAAAPVRKHMTPDQIMGTLKAFTAGVGGKVRSRKKP